MMRLADEQICEYLLKINNEKEIDFEIRDIADKKELQSTSVDTKVNQQSNQKSKDVDLLYLLNNFSIHQNNNFMNKDVLSFSLCNRNSNTQIPSSFEFVFLNSNEGSQQLQCKEKLKYNFLSLLSSNNYEDLFKTIVPLLYSSANGKSGCLFMLVQLIYCTETDLKVKRRAVEALFNIVSMESDDKCRNREINILKILEQIRKYYIELKLNSFQNALSNKDDTQKHPIAALGALLKLSFDAEYRQAISNLGGLYALTELLQIDHETHGTAGNDVACNTLRRYAGMTLTNLTFGDNKNKNLLCSLNKFMFALVEQLENSSEDLQQVNASIIRNLSWKADEESKYALRAVGIVRVLTSVAMAIEKESTLKAVLSALWNLSAHCSENKVWIIAFEDTIIALSIGMLALPFISSHGKFTDDIFIDTLIVIFAELFCCLLVATPLLSVITSIKSEEEYRGKVHIEDAIDVFIWITESFTLYVHPNVLWAFIFFLEMIIFIIGTQTILSLAVCETVLGAFDDPFSFLWMSCLMSLISFLFTTPFILIPCFDFYPLATSLITILFLASITVEIFYGKKKFSDDFHFMMGDPPSILLSLIYTNSILATAMFIILKLIYSIPSEPFKQIVYVYTGIPILIYIISAVRQFYNAQQNGRIMEAFTANPNWGPSNPILKESRIVFNSQAVTKEFMYRQELYKKPFIKPHNYAEQNIVQLI